MEGRRSGDNLHVLLRTSILERQILLWKRAHHVEQKASGDDGASLAPILNSYSHPNPNLHVGGLELGLAVVHVDHHAGQRLDRTPTRHATHRDSEVLEERFP